MEHCNCLLDVTLNNFTRNFDLKNQNLTQPLEVFIF